MCSATLEDLVVKGQKLEYDYQCIQELALNQLGGINGSSTTLISFGSK